MNVLIEDISSVQDEDLQNKPDYVTDERWKKILRIRPLEDKKRSLLAGKLLCQMCEKYGIANPVYGTVGSGKPILLDHSQLAFSLSHSGEYVVLVYDEVVKAIGVDIQQIRAVSEGVKKRILHEKEWLHFHNAGDQKDVSIKEMDEILTMENLLLNRIWAIKESYVKMTGEGLSHDFRKLCIDFEKGTVTDENLLSAYYKELEVPDGYVAAVTIDNKE